MSIHIHLKTFKALSYTMIWKFFLVVKQSQSCEVYIWYLSGLIYSENIFSNSNVNYFWSIKNSSEVIEKLRLRNVQGSQVSSFDFSTLYTSLPPDLIKAKVLSLVTWCFNRESKSYLCNSDKAGFFSNKKYDSYKCWTCAEICEGFTFLMENIYVQFEGMVYINK